MRRLFWIAVILGAAFALLALAAGVDPRLAWASGAGFFWMAMLFVGIVDLLAVLPFYVTRTVDLRSIRGIRLIRLFRLFKLGRYSRAIARLKSAFLEVREELVVYVSVTAFLIYISAVGIYYFERDAQPEHFQSVFHCLWWAVITLTTVGYGDVYPVTLGGRIFTFFVVLLGIGVVAVPSGLLASALTRLGRTDAKGSDDTHEH